jgi:uncharacterized membrane protein
MSDRLSNLFNGFLVAAIFAVAAFAIYQMPTGGQVAIHWGPDFRPDAWVGASAIHLVNPVVALIIWVAATFFHQGFATKHHLKGTALSKLSNVLLVQLVIQLLLALYIRSS